MSERELKCLLHLTKRKARSADYFTSSNSLFEIFTRLKVATKHGESRIYVASSLSDGLYRHASEVKWGIAVLRLIQCKDPSF